MPNLQTQFNLIKEGKGNKNQFLKHARIMFPDYFNQYTNFDTAVSVLKSKQIINEAVGGVITKGFDIWDWKKILAEEVKAEEKETSKEVLDDQKNSYNNSDMKNADNINFNEIMKGFYAELKDSKNQDKTSDEIKSIVIKNLAKDCLHYTKDGMFGIKGVGYTDEAPGLGQPKEPKGKFKSSGYGDLKENKPGTQNTYNQEINWIKYEVDYVPDDIEVYEKWPEPYKSKVLKALEYRKKYFDSMRKEKLDSLKENKETSNKLKEIGMFHDPIGFKKPELSDIDKMFTKEYKGDGVYDIYKNGEKVKTIDGEGNANAWINDEKRKLKEAIDQGPVSIKGKTGPTGGTAKIPRALFLDKEVISTINNAHPGSIKLISKPGDKRVYMYVSSFVKNALDELERGRSSREKLKKQSLLADILSDKLPSAIRGKIKKEINPKMDSGLKMHYVDLNISPKKDKTGYWVLAKGESEPLVTENLVEQKLRSLIRNIIKEELVNEISPELFKRATDISRERGQDRRTSSMGETFFNKFKGRPLMGGTITNVSYIKPQSGDYEEVYVEIKVPFGLETKSIYIYYDVRKDQWGIDKEITRTDARIFSLIAQHINPDTRYKSGTVGFNIKGY